jgi:hypothetical protein
MTDAPTFEPCRCREMTNMGPCPACASRRQEPTPTRESIEAPLRARIAEQAAEIERLRSQNHEAAARRDREHAQDASVIARMRACLERGARMMEDPAGSGLGFSANQQAAVASVLAKLEDAELRCDRSRAERAAVLSVKTTDGLTSSEWLLRTALAEERAEKAEALAASLKRAHAALLEQERRGQAGETRCSICRCYHGSEVQHECE